MKDVDEPPCPVAAAGAAGRAECGAARGGQPSRARRVLQLAPPIRHGFCVHPQS
jgi:hypothetical protein